MTAPKTFINPKFSPMCRAASKSDSRFPLELKFPTPQAAQSFRCEFYGYRRALQRNPAAKFDPDLIQELDGANALECARVDYDTKTPDGKTLLTIRLRTQRPAFTDAYNLMADLFPEEVTDVTKAESFATETSETLDQVSIYEADPVAQEHTIEADNGYYTFTHTDVTPRADSTYLLLIKRGVINASFTPNS